MLSASQYDGENTMSVEGSTRDASLKGFEIVLSLFPGVSAAPHLPAGTLSPYSDGERGAVIGDLTNRRPAREPALRLAPSPVTI